MEVTLFGLHKYLTLSFISFVPKQYIVRNVIKDLGRHDLKLCSLTSLETMPSEVVLDQENDYPGDTTAVMSDTLTANGPLLIRGESTTLVTPAKNSLSKYEKENSRLKRVGLKLRSEINLRRSCTSVIIIIILIQLVFMDERQSQLSYRKCDNNKKLEMEKLLYYCLSTDR